MLVLSLTGSPAAAGFAVFAATAPSILVYIPAGALVDRWDPRRTMLATESLRGVTIAVVVVSLTFHRPSVPLIIGMAVTEEILEVFGLLAERRYVRVLVPGDASSALVRMEARTHVVVLAGRPLGGLLFELRPIFPFLVDVASFFISVVMLAGIGRKRAVRAVQVSRSQLAKEDRTALRWLLRDRFARLSMALAACMTLVSQALIMAFLVESHTAQLSSAAIGIVLAASGLGGAFGAVTGSRWHVLGGQPRIKIQPFIWAMALFVLTISPQSWQVPCMAVVMMVLGYTGAMGNVELDTYLVERVPECMLARVTSIGRLMSFSACALGPALGGTLIGSYGIQLAVFSLFVMTLAFAAISFRVPPLTAPNSAAGRAANGEEAARAVRELAKAVGELADAHYDLTKAVGRLTLAVGRLAKADGRAATDAPAGADTRAAPATGILRADLSLPDPGTRSRPGLQRPELGVPVYGTART
jgi:predicted MFS family arabinose efflux permease